MKKYLNEETIAEEKYSKYFLEDLSCTERPTEINFSRRTFLYGCQDQTVILLVSYDCNTLTQETAHSNGNCKNHQKH